MTETASEVFSSKCSYVMDSPVPMDPMDTSGLALVSTGRKFKIGRV